MYFMKIKLKPIEEQVVVVVGATSGIGRLTAQRFAERGAKVVVVGRDEPALATLMQEVHSRGGEAISVTADVSDYAQVQAIAYQALAAFDRIDTWVHAAAASIYAQINDITPEELKRVIEVNLVGQMYGAHVALPVLQRQNQGALIHISSVESRRAMPFHVPYTASKFGVRGFLDALRMELEYQQIPVSVTNIMPASINTPLFDKAVTRLGVKPRPIPPVYSPEIVADVILYAAENPVREIYAGGAGQGLGLLQRISPRLVDRLVRPFSVRAQTTNEPKTDRAPSNLFRPIQGLDQVEGSFSHESKPFSAYTWLQTHPKAQAGLTASLLLVGVLGAGWAFLARQRA